MSISETSSTPADDAVRGAHTAGGNGVHGISDTGPGVLAISTSGRGLEASSTSNYGVRASCGGTLAGLRASSVGGRGAEGWSTDHEGVVGISKTSIGVYGTGTGTAGVLGDSQASRGVEGRSGSGVGVYGVSNGGPGVEGSSPNADGVVGLGTTGGRFEGTFEGVHAVGHSDVAAGLAAYNDHKGPALYARNTGGGAAAYVDGDLVVTGVIHMNRGDYAEEFTVADRDGVRPGMVMVLDDAGGVRRSDRAYDGRVAGVVSGAGDHQPAVVLDHRDACPDRMPLALMGKAFCLVDASEAAVGVGDLLTTSSVPGHAMKAVDPARAFGAVIGKALQPLASGRGLVPILVRLQ